MSINPNRDPLDPRDPAADPIERSAYVDPRVVNKTEVYPSSGRSGLALAAVLAALLVIGFIAFTGTNEGVDPNTTATPGVTTEEELIPGSEPVTPSPDAIAPTEEAPAAEQPIEEAPAEPAPVE